MGAVLALVVGWRASVGSVQARVMWVVYAYVLMCALFRLGVI